MTDGIKLLQCGYGSIGKVLYKEFDSMAEACGGILQVYDPYVENCPDKVCNLEEHYDMAFVCVPTDSNLDGSADISVVVDCCRKIKADIIVIKSTIPVTAIEFLPENAVYSPEFTSSTPHGGVHNYVVLGGKREFCNKVAQLYAKIHDAAFKILYTDIKTAIMAKYMDNCFLAMKVTFCNEIAKACKAEDIEYDDVRNIFTMDSRINPSHTFVYEDQPYYDSHCLNKDVAAFNSQYNLPLMKEVERINRLAKESSLNSNKEL